MEIPANLISSLNADPDSVPLSSIQQTPIGQWLQAIDAGTLNVRAKKRLAQASAGVPEFLPVARRLLLQVGFGNALAIEIASEPRWSELQSLIDQAGLRGTDTHEDFVRHLGPLLVQKRLLFWCLRVALSRRTASAFVSMFADRETSVRLEALRALKTYDISETESDLVYALDDTSDQVRSEALQTLKERLSPERLAMITAEAVEEAGLLSELVRTAKSVYQKIPGVEHVLVSCH
jgi:HEAT repeat protein